MIPTDYEQQQGSQLSSVKLTVNAKGGVQAECKWVAVNGALPSEIVDGAKAMLEHAAKTIPAFVLNPDLTAKGGG